MAQIDKLTIKVESNGLGAAKALAKITDQLKLMNKAVSEGGMLKIVHQTERLSNATASAAKKTNHFLASIVRIAKYRMLRTALKEMTQAFREGIGNLYQYSTALKSTDAAANKNTMDTYASSLLYLKNAAGAAAGPLLQALLPVVQQLVDWFVAGANAVNQFISALQGKSTFTKAVYTMTEFGDQTARASGAAKELKKTILGFDELNLLQVNNPSGGGGGSSTPDYSKMFEEAKISDTWMKIGEVVKPIIDWMIDHLGIAGSLAVGIGAALLALKIPGLVIDFFKYLGTLAKSGIDKVLGVLGANFGIVALEAGLAAGAIALMWYGVEEGKKRWESSEEYAQLQKTMEEIRESAMRADEAYNEFNGSVETWAQKFADLEYAKTLVDQIYDIYENADKTNDEILEMQGLIEELNGLGIEDLRIEYNSATGEINLTRDAIYEVIDALDEQYQMEAKKQLLIESYRTQLRLGAEKQKQDQKRLQLLKNLEIAEERLAKERANDYQSRDGFQIGMVGDAAGWTGIEWSEVTPAYQEAARAVQKYKDDLAECEGVIESTNEKMEDVNRTITYLKNNNFGKVFEDGGSAADSASGKISKAGNSVETFGKKSGTARKDIVHLADSETMLGGIKLNLPDEEVNAFGNSASTAKTKTDAFGNSINQFGQRFNEATGKVSGFGTTVKNVNGQLVDSNGNVIKLHDSMQKLIEYRAAHMGSEEAITNAKNKVAELSREFQNMTKDYKVTFSADITKLVDMRMELEKARDAAYKLAGYKPAMSAGQRTKMNELVLSAAYEINMGTMKGYASGGFPESGSMFLAGEGGSPEMVGTINGKTAVANSDQIVQAVSSGVYSAVVAAMNGTNGRNNDIHVTLQLGEYELANAVVSALNNQTRRIGYSQLEGV